MSRYLVDKFLFTVDRDPALVERYRRDPAATLEWWERNLGRRILNCVEQEQTTWTSFTPAEREALCAHDYVTLFELGAHPFLSLTLWIAMFERDYEEPLGIQLAYAAGLSHVVLPYPDITT